MIVRSPARGPVNRGLRVGVGLGAAALTACGSDSVERQWASRESLPSCGSVRLVEEPLRVAAQKEVTCLDRALESGRGAELAVRFSTVEGDPVAEYYRVLPDGSAEVYVDSTEDEFGEQKWSYSRCGTPESALDVNC